MIALRSVLILLALFGLAACAPAAVTVTVSPSSATLYSSQTQQFTAKLSGTTIAYTITWTCTAGKITASGLYTAPVVASKTVATVTATQTGHRWHYGKAVVTVLPRAVQHSVDLNWDASAGAVRYSAYRGNVSGGPYALLASAITATAWTDSSVVSGQTYYYVVTASDSSGQESGYSNEGKAVVPSP